jgi:hypothetical protein
MLSADRRPPHRFPAAGHFHSDRHIIGLQLILLAAIVVIVMVLEVPPAGWIP